MVHLNSVLGYTMIEQNMAPIICNIALGVQATIGLLYAAMPWLMPSYDCFSITIPIDMEKRHEILSMKYQYTALIAISSATLTCCGVLCKRIAPNSVAEFGVAGLTLQVLTTLLVFHVFRDKVKKLKQRECWGGRQSQQAVSIFDPSLPKPASFLCELIAAPIIMLTLALSIFLYPQMPDYIPVQFSLNGIPTSILHKAPFIIAIPSTLQLISTAIFLLSHYLAIHSKRKIRPELPLESARAYHLFLKMKCMANLASNIVLSFALLLLPIMFSGHLSFYQFLAIVVFAAVIVGFINSFVNIYYGQAGSNYTAAFESSSKILFDDDSRWLGGFLYFNPTDSSTIVPKRFGYGWTFNFASPWTWACLALLIILYMLLTFASNSILIRT